MAMRYSGQVTVSIRFDDRNDQYVASVQSPGGRETVHVPWKWSTKGVDTPEAYDDAARAAISFAERTKAGDYATYDESGTSAHVGRMKSRAWPRERPKTKKGALAGVLAALKRLE